MRRSETGSIIILLAFVPAILGLLFFLLFFSKLITLYNDGLYKCRRESLNIQGRLSKDLEKILALNSTASTLRAERAAAEAMVVASSGNPISLASALKRRQIVVLKQNSFGFYQKSLIRLAEQKANVSFLKLNSLFRQFGFRQVTTPHVKLHLVPRPPESPSPDHVPKQNFEFLQRQQVSWTIPKHLIHSNISSLSMVGSKSQESDIEVNCESGLQRKGQTWLGTLVAAKSLLK